MPPLLIFSYDLEQTVLILSEQCLILHTFLLVKFNWTILMISVKKMVIEQRWGSTVSHSLKKEKVNIC